jgi:hypothetical protein
MPLTKATQNVITPNIVTTDTTQTITGIKTISTSSTSTALTITQTGTGDAFKIEDSTNPDNSPFAIDNDGNVGIGTTSPEAKLHIVMTEGSASGYTGKILVDNNFQRLFLGAYWEPSAGQHGIVSAIDDSGAGTPLLLNKAGGNVAIGNINPSYLLQLATDSAAKPSTNTWTIASDERVKENIKPFTKGLDAINSIKPVIYDYNGNAGFEKIKNNVGVIAQEIKDIVPEGISTFKAKLNENDSEKTELYNFNSHALTYILINAVKELSAKVAELEAK